MKRTLATAAILALPTLAAAQTVTIYEPVPDPVMKPIERNDAGVVRAQFIRAGDVSPEEYQRLLAEADKVRAYQSHTGSLSQPTYTHTPAATPIASAPPVVSVSGTTVTAITVQPSTTHRVVKGDTLYNIAKRNGVTVDALKAANNLGADAITLGQALLIPTTTQTVVQPVSAFNSYSGVVQASQPAPSATVDRAYAVAPGDTLYSISRRACTTVGALRATNGLNNNAISPGQRLALPSGHCLK